MHDVFYSFKKQTANSVEVIAKIGDYDFRRVMQDEEFEAFKQEILNPCDFVKDEQ